MAQVHNTESEEGTSKIPAETISPKRDVDFISTLPTRDWLMGPLILYKNYWFRSRTLKNILLVQEIFKPRRDDVILATHPKSGTTWLKALTFAITNRSRYTWANHPLLTQHPQHVVPSLEFPLNGVDLAYIQTLPSPRLLATHMPFSLLPPPTDNCGAYRVVYLCRDPKDVLVSFWYFWKRTVNEPDLELDQMFNTFCEGFSPLGPIWNHCLEYWKESKTRPDEVLFLKYEDIMSKPVQSVIRLARFLHVPFTAEEESIGLPAEVVRLCSFEMLTSLEINKKGTFDFETLKIENNSFFRRGMVGDWENHISKDMGNKLDSIAEDKFRGSDTKPYMYYSTRKLSLHVYHKDAFLTSEVRQVLKAHHSLHSSSRDNLGKLLSMDIVTGAMTTLLPKLAEQLGDEYKLQKGAPDDVSILQDELKSMHAASSDKFQL